MKDRDEHLCNCSYEGHEESCKNHPDRNLAAEAALADAGGTDYMAGAPTRGVPLPYDPTN